MVRIFIGVAWPYANGPFHIGHLAGAYLPGDIFARYHRLRGNEVLFVSGSDMHGTPVLVTAEKERSTPEEVSRRYDAVNRAAFHDLGVSFDLFTSTHTLLHERTVQELFLGLLRKGLVDRRTEQYAFCPKHARFLPDRYLVGTCPHCGFDSARGDECDRCGRVLESRELGSPRCALCGTAAEFRPSEHFFLRLDRLAEPVGQYLADKGHWRGNVLAFSQNFLNAGLRPTPITRDLDWGVPIPLDGYPTKRFYVWFEAVIGYLSAAREWAMRRGEPEAWLRFWAPEEPVRAYYFVGKDNIYYHTLFWPAVLLGVGGLQLPYDVPANEWVVTEGGKLSKSRAPGGDISIPEMLREFPADAIRFYAALLAPEHHDTVFQWREFHQLTDQVLANQWGNLVQRILAFARERCEGKVPSPPPDYDPGRAEIRARLSEAHLEITRLYEEVRLKEALERTLVEVREANRRFHDAAPWQANDPDRRRAVYEGVWFLRAAAVWLAPVLPWSTAEVFRMIGAPHPPGAGAWETAIDPPVAETPLGEVRPLFPRSTPSRAAGGRERRAASPAPPASGALPEPLAPLEIRAVRIVRVEPHPSADRLYRLDVELGGSERRTVVAGLRPFLPPEALLGQSALLLANLAPRTIRSVTSHGMILAAEGPAGVFLLRPPAGTEPGATVEGVPAPARTISIEELERTPLRIGRVDGPDGSGASRVSLGDGEVIVPGLWPAGELLVVRTGLAEPSRADVIAFGPGRGATVDPKVGPGAKVR